MQIDWFTVGAQVINFLILVFLLKKFLYKPVIDAMERREQALVQSRQQVENESTAAQEQTRLYQNKLQEIEQQKNLLMAQARQDAETEKEKLLQQLRVEVDESDQRWRAEVDREKSNFVTESRQIMGREIIRVSRKVLSDLADANLQQQVINVFLQKLKNLTADEEKKLASALANLSLSKLTIVSSFEIQTDQQKQIIEAIRQHIPTEIELETDIDTELLCGLILRIPGGEFEWNIESYLNELEDSLIKNLSTPATAG